MSWTGDPQTDRILKHLAEIGAGQCTITDDAILAEPDADMRQILLGLLVLCEDLGYASRQRQEAVAALQIAAEERERLLDDRREAIAARDQFLAIAAHELRTPLTTLALLVDHLNPRTPHAPAAGPESVVVQGRQLGLLRRQVDRLMALVGQMLDVSRITGDRLDLVLSAVDLRDVVREVLDRFEIEIARRKVTVIVEMPPDPVRGTWDAARIDQVVTNLVSNALKYGAGRPIDVAIRVHGGCALIVVRDQGIGIPDDEQSKIFGPFARAVTATHHAGLGLGLWIARQIVHASGGRIRVESQPGEGSTFTVELPL